MSLGGSVLAARHAPLSVSRRLAASAPRANLLVVDEPGGRCCTSRVGRPRAAPDVESAVRTALLARTRTHPPPPARLADHVGRITPSAMERPATCWLLEAAAAVWRRHWRPAIWAVWSCTEAGSRAGGQLTSQAVPPDEHPWVETTGITARYRQLREAVRTRYQQSRRLTEQARQDPLFNPGAAG